MVKLYIAAMGVVLLSGCEKQDALRPEQPSVEGINKQEVQLKFFVDEGSKLIPYEDYWNAVNAPQLMPLTRAGGLVGGFKLYGVHNTVDVPEKKDIPSTEAAPADKRFFDYASINGDGTYTGERRYWIADGKTRHSFAAITGLGDHVSANPLLRGFELDPFIPVADYFLDPDPTKQSDLLLTYGPVNVIVDGVTPVVNIKFKHALSKIIFKVISSGGVTLYNCNLNVTYSANTVRNNVSYYYTTEMYQMKATYLSGTYALGAKVTIPSTAMDQSAAVEVGNMKLNSLDMPANWLGLSLSYAKVAGGSELGPIKAKLPAQQLRPGMQYTYYVYVSELAEELSIANITVEPWTTEIRVADPLN